MTDEERLQAAMDDGEYTTYTLTGIGEPFKGKDGVTRVEIRMGSSIFAPEIPEGFELPKVGDIVRLYGKGMGYTIRGAAFINFDREDFYRLAFYRTAEEEEARHQEWCRKYDEEKAARKKYEAENPIPDTTGKYKFTQEMGEISGFGGWYEQTCRNMLAAALRWFDENPEGNPVFQGFEGVMGLCIEDNEDAKALTKAIGDAANGDFSGAMHQAVVRSAFYVKKHGWDAYVAEMSKPKT